VNSAFGAFLLVYSKVISEITFPPEQPKRNFYYLDVSEDIGYLPLFL